MNNTHEANIGFKQAVLKTAVSNRLMALAMILAAWLCAQCFAQTASTPKIRQIVVDTALTVLGPGTSTSTTINGYVGGGLPDEHSSILPPGTLPHQTNYLFFVATPMPQINEHGTVVLQSVSTEPPARNNPWRLDFATGYGKYGSAHGPVFSPAMERSNCPTADDTAVQDPTFDLNYAGVATVFLDPTNPTNDGGGNLLMVYEGTNICIGIASGTNSGNSFESTIGIATSNDDGRTWPTYAANFTPLPGINQWNGPWAPLGAWGWGVCQGNYCTDIDLLAPPNQYGRYAVSGPATTVEEAMRVSKQGLADTTGDSEPSAFVDDVPGRSSPPYVYAVHTYRPGSFSKNSPLYPLSPGGTVEEYPNVVFDLSISRAQLNGGRERLKFYHWYEGGFTEPGLGSDAGGRETAIYATRGLGEDLGAYRQCLTPIQRRSDGSISYSQDTHEYVLMFVCVSPTNPQTETQYPPARGAETGGTWFYSTLDADQYDLSQQDQWSAPRQMLQSSTTSPAPAFWSHFQPGGCVQNLDGWYPTMMSANAKPGYIGTTGWVFFLDGCEGADPTRSYATRFFTIIPDWNAKPL